MKKFIILILLLFMVFVAHSQVYSLTDVEEYAINLLKTQIINLRGDSARLQNQILLIQKDPSMQVQIEQQRNKEIEILKQIAQTYNQPFDELIESVTALTVGRDLSLVVDEKLSDLQKYFWAKHILTQKYDAAKTRTALNDIREVKQQSKHIENLRYNLENYELCNDALKKVVEQIIKIDESKIAGRVPSISAQKSSEIMMIVTKFMFDFDFNFSHYPYLSKIINDLLIRKYGNVDESIDDLLNRLL